MIGLGQALSLALAPKGPGGPPWVLANGVWNDTGVWDDAAAWKDA